MRDIFEFIGDCLFALSLFVQYMLYEAWGFARYVGRLAWVVLLLAPTAHAGGYCYHNDYVRHEYVTTPTTIIEHQNNEIFYSVGAGVRDYAVAQQNVAAAQAGQLERQIAGLQTQLAGYRQQAQPAATPAQVVYAVPVTAVAAACLPGQPGQMPMPAQAGAAPAPQPAAPAAKPDGIVEQRCVKCHSGPNPKGRFDITGKLTCNQATLAIKKVLEGKMPKEDTKFTADEIAKFSAEILGATQPVPSDAEAE